jgi:hypothetical protein
MQSDIELRTDLGREFIESMRARFEMATEADETLLMVAAASLDNLIDSQAAFTADGALARDSKGIVKAHPAVGIIDKASRSFVSAIKALDIPDEDAEAAVRYVRRARPGPRRKRKAG